MLPERGTCNCLQESSQTLVHNHHVMKRDYDTTMEGVEELGLRPRHLAFLGALTLHMAEISGKVAAILRDEKSTF